MKLRTIALLLFFPIFCQGQDEDLKTSSVSIFSDGNAFYVKDGIIAPTGGKYFFYNEKIPQARYGTLWFASSTSALLAFKSYNDTTLSVATRTIKDLSELLSLNLEKKATLKLQESELTGIIKGVEFQKGAATLVHVLTDDQRWVSLKPEEIKMAGFEEKPLISKMDSIKKPTKTLELTFKEKGKEVPLKMMYLQKGLSWNPFYYLQIKTGQSAQITMRAEVINDAEHIHDARLNLVVGEANFKYAEKMAGLVKFNKILDPSAEADNRNFYNYDMDISEVILQQPAKRSFEAQIISEEVEDYYFYPIEHVDLPMHSRAHFELFSTNVNYEDIYECTLTEQINLNNMYGNTQPPQQENKVYHSLKIHNKSNNPLAEAPVFLLDEQGGDTKPLAQDRMEYTPINAKSLVKISESKDVEIKSNEIITVKDEEGQNIWGRRYYKAVVKGSIKIISYKNEAIKLELSHLIHGNILNTSLPWEIVWQKVQSSPNDINMVRWNIDLEKGEEKTIEYEYEVLVDR
ncbi:MAG: hypothetical protein HC819_00125 [Cyclobacteriaceae bacterium]|nr:hypothetical protein [Cyclobacteriaceae bacterium]